MTKLYVLDGPDKGLAFDLVNEITFIGRTPRNHIHLKDPYVSRRHLQVLRRGTRYFIKDLNSTNGTSVDGEALNPGVEHEVQEGTTIVIGVSVICLGERCVEEIKAFLDSIHVSTVSKAANDRETVALKVDPESPQY
jgi:pSer/pThr/pTyr-binding forkhead associated (FHA) protein